MLELRLGIAGTAKNTGKTTTTAAVLQELRHRQVPFFLTSIGYDGEDIDNITGLPKPKLRVEPGDIVATAERCLTASTAKFKIIEPTAVKTPLGRIVIAKVITAGLAVTAGPNKSAEVVEIDAILRQIGPGVTLLDGALNRIAPMVATDGFILATGAARTADIPRLARETNLIGKIANLPLVPQALQIAERALRVVTVLDNNLRQLACFKQGSLLSEQDAIAAIAAAKQGGAYLYVPGIISECAFDYLAQHAAELPRNLLLTLADPIKILAFASPLRHYAWIEQLEQHHIFTGVVKRVPLIAVTLNPFFPEFRVETATYHPAFVDPLRLQVAVSAQISIPVYNVIRQGAKGLVDKILAQAHEWEHPSTIKF